MNRFRIYAYKDFLFLLQMLVGTAIIWNSFIIELKQVYKSGKFGNLTLLLGVLCGH